MAFKFKFLKPLRLLTNYAEQLMFQLNSCIAVGYGSDGLSHYNISYKTTALEAEI